MSGAKIAINTQSITMTSPMTAVGEEKTSSANSFTLFQKSFNATLNLEELFVVEMFSVVMVDSYE
jgi:hypothetical protein